jgi:hypothetical protein
MRVTKDGLSLALERAAQIMAGTVTYIGHEKQLARALIELWQQQSTPRPEAAAFDLKRDYRKLGLINAQCPRCLMDVYLPEPKHPLFAAGSDEK